MSAYVPVQLQRQIRAQFRGCCAYCQTAEVLTAVTFEFEHIVPLAAGGQTKFENLALACPSCNRYKSDRQSAIDPLTNTSASLFHPHQHVWFEHFQWNSTSTEIEGLSTIGRATIFALKMNRPALVRVRTMWVKLGEHPPS
jgi:hypothetical protein